MSTEKHDDVSRIFDDTGKSMDQNVIFDQFLKIQLSPDISSTQSKKKYPNLPPLFFTLKKWLLSKLSVYRKT